MTNIDLDKLKAALDNLGAVSTAQMVSWLRSLSAASNILAARHVGHALYSTFIDDMRKCEVASDVLEAASDLIAEVERLRSDNIETDGTDFAHPSYWRGCDATFAAMSEQLRKILDGEYDCSGVCQEPWDTLRRRVLALRQELATAKAVGESNENL